jgi:L-Ala-D/L-Glu epimerase
VHKEVCVSEIRCSREVLALRETFRTAVRTTDVAETLCVHIIAEDATVGTGYGTATPLITGDTLDSMEAFVNGPVRDTLMGKPATPELCDALAAIALQNSSGAAAADLALHYLIGLHHPELPLQQVAVPTSVTISADTVENMVAAALRRIDLGFQTLKLKLGADPDGDLARLVHITARVEGRATIWVDANQGWDADIAIRIMSECLERNCAPSMLEQPCAASDLEGLGAVAAAVPLPVFADESARRLGDVARVAACGPIAGVNLKFMKFGGLTGTHAAAASARERGLEVLVGSMMEHPGSVAAAARFAADFPGTHDLDAGWWFQSHAPLRYVGGVLHVN